MYYLRIVRHHPIADSDFVVFVVPTLLALVMCFAAVTAGRSHHQKPLPLIARLVSATVLAAIGHAIAMLTALNTWGA
jgi:hypothetical protein